VLLTEFKAGLNEYLNAWAQGAPVKTLADLIEFNKQHAPDELPWFGQEQFEQAQKMGDLKSAAYKKALEKSRRLSRAQGLDAAFAKYKVDAIVAATAGPAWLIDPINGDHFGGGSSTPSAVAGYPALAVPAGNEHGLPMNITFMGPAWSEGKLIQYAYAFEQATKARKPATLQKTLALGSQ
jgi:amidase